MPGGSDQTNVKRARHFVKTGRAVLMALTDGAGTIQYTIRFLDVVRDAAVARAVNQRAADRLQHERQALGAMEYDRIHRSFFSCAENIPVIQPQKLINKGGSSRAWSYRAAVDRGPLRPPVLIKSQSAVQA